MQKTFIRFAARWLLAAALLHFPDAVPAVGATIDEDGNVVILNELSKQTKPTSSMQGNRLCRTRDSEGGVGIANHDKTIRQFIGSHLESISVMETANFETHERFSLAREAILDALQKSPIIFSRYEPWANTVSPDFICRLNYRGGKGGEFRLAYGYVCFQTEDGKHWWSRFTNLDDINAKSITGVLGFQSNNGYFIEEHDKHRIWLQVPEDKILVRNLETLIAKRVTAKGELKRVPLNVTMSIPKGCDYLANGFYIVPCETNPGPHVDK